MSNLFNWFKKKPQVIDLYAVVVNSYNEPTSLKDLAFLTITATKQESEEYINKRLFLENKEHFKQWCELNEFSPTDEDAWKEYVKRGIVALDKYVIYHVKYKSSDVATIFRMFNECLPIGTSYDEEVEILKIIEKIPADVLEGILAEENIDDEEETLE